MNEELEYAEMLEIPVNTVNVTKKKSIFKRRQKPRPDDLKAQVVESVNERMGAYTSAEDLTDPPKPVKKKREKGPSKRDRASIVLWTEAALVGAIAIGIFVTNLLMPSTLINTFIGSFSKTHAEEPVYTDFTLSPVVSAFSDTAVTVTDDGVICFTAEGCVYPVCEGSISRVYENDGVCTVEIAHTSTFTSVITGLDKVYYGQGTAVAANLPVGYSSGDKEVKITLYDNGNLLSCFALDGATLVWQQ